MCCIKLILCSNTRTQFTQLVLLLVAILHQIECLLEHEILSQIFLRRVCLITRFLKIRHSLFLFQSLLIVRHFKFTILFILGNVTVNSLIKLICLVIAN
jgi:hypothetical protein